MSKHSEAVEHLKAIAKHCDLYIGENKTCCGCVFALGWSCAVRELVSDTQGVIEDVQKRVEELERQEKP
jgi:hypothetical protein